jgi:outer membrane receptor protein involved in Fe transport
LDLPPEPPVVVATVVIQAPRLPAPAGDAAFSTVRIDPSVLSAYAQLDDALASSPSFSLYRRTSSLGANPTTQGVSLRGIAGSGASRALVTLDGVPQNDPFGGWVIWTALPPETISGATLVRGAGAGRYGAGALTGVVDLTEPTHLDTAVSGDLEGGDPGFGRAAAIGEIESGAARLFLDAAGETSGGWVPVREGRGAADRPLTLQDWTAAERALVEVGDAVVSERISAYQEIRGAGAVDAGSRDYGAQASLTATDPPHGGALGWQAQAWVAISDLQNTSASVSANRNTATLADDQYATPAIGVGASGELRGAGPGRNWALGVDVRDFDGRSEDRLYNSGVPTGVRTAGGGEMVAGVYLEGDRTVGPWLVTGGVRLDGWEDYQSKLVQTGSSALVQHTDDRGGVVPTGRVGVRNNLSKAIFLRAAAYAGFRPATLNELHRPFRVGSDVTEANADLTPERLYGVEAGMGGQGRVVWDTDVFFNQLANAITNVTLGKGPGSFPLAGFVPAGGTLYERQNAGDVNAYGLEGSVQSAVGRKLTLRFAYALTHARVDGGARAPQLTGKRPALTPSTTLTAGLVWRPVEPLTFTAEARYEGARFDDDLNTRRIKGGTGVDARARWRLNASVAAFVAVENLFDANLQTGRSAANVVTWDAPRLVRVGLDLRR